MKKAFELLEALLKEKIKTLNEEQKEAQEEANINKSDVEAYTPFKEEAQAKVQILGKKIKSLTDEFFLFKSLTSRRLNSNNLFSFITLTSEGKEVYFFLSPILGGGKICYDDKSFFITTPSSPMGEKLIDIFENDTFNLNNKEFTVEKISKNI